VGIREWFGRGKRQGGPQSAPTLDWHVQREAGEVVVDDGRGKPARYPVTFARSVRVVPLTGGNPHGGSGHGWQVTLSSGDGDVLVGTPLSDWRSARALADQLCQATDLPLDELTQRLFSQVGQYTANNP
jgi:hypothetical protein